MTSEALPVGRRGKGEELRAIGLVSAAHFVAHFHMLVLPPLFSASVLSSSALR